MADIERIGRDDLEIKDIDPITNTREKCQRCERISPVGFWVPNAVWHAAVPRRFRHGPLCISCFALFADEKLIVWDADIRFYTVSFARHIGFGWFPSPLGDEGGGGREVSA